MRVSLVLVLAFFSVLLAGCPATNPTRPNSNYPSEVTNFAEFERFPAKASGYRRGKVTAYAPALADYSVAYDAFGSVLQNAVTLYFYPRMIDTAAQLSAEKAEVAKAHPGARVISERTLTLQQASRAYEATVVTFAYASNFEGRWQDVSSQLVVVFLPQGTFKVRSTAPIAQGALAENALRQLLAEVSWAP